MAKLFDLPDDIAFDALSEHADQLNADIEQKKEVVGPEDSLNADKNAKASVNEEQGQSIEFESSPNIQVNVETPDIEQDGTDLLPLEEQLQELSDKADETNEALESIDGTLQDQFEAEERDRRKNMIESESSPFSAYIDDDVRDNTSNDSPSGNGLLGGLLGGLGGGIFGGGRGKDGNSRGGPERKRDKIKKWGGRGLVGAAAALAGYVGLSTFLSKTDQGSVGDLADKATGDDGFLSSLPLVGSWFKDNDEPINNPVAAEIPRPVENSTISESSQVTYLGYGLTDEEKQGVINNTNTPRGQSLQERRDARDARLSTEQQPVQREAADDSSYAPQMLAAGASGLGALGYFGSKALMPALGSLKDKAIGLKDSLFASKASEVTEAIDTPDRVTAPKKGFLSRLKPSGAGIAGLAVSAAMLGSDIVDQRSQEYETDREKNKDTAKLVGQFGGDAAAGLAGAAAGAAMGSVVPIVGTAIGGLVGGAVGYFASAETGFGEMVGNATAAVYDAAASAVDMGSSMIESIGNFFSFSEDKAEAQAKDEAELIKTQQTFVQTSIDKIENIQDNVNRTPVSTKTSPVKPKQTYAQQVNNANGGASTRFNAPDFVGHDSSYDSYREFIRDNNLTDYSMSDYVYELNKSNESTADINTVESNRIYANREAADIKDSESDAQTMANAVQQVMPKPEKPKAGGGLVKGNEITKRQQPVQQSATQLTKPTLSSVPVIIEDATLSLMNMGHI